MPEIHPALIAHIQAMHDDLGDMMDNPQDYDMEEALELSMLLLDVYEGLLSQFGILNFSDDTEH